MASNKKFFAFSLFTMFSAFAFCVGTFAWFMTSLPGTKDDQVIDGEIGLRTYFHEGNGSEQKPYEITLPIHFYNLSRLQNLGVFQNEKNYFRLGHDFNNDGNYYVISGYDEHGEPILSKTLDMESISQNSTIVAIGGEGAPFIGSFDGNDIIIKNLQVTGHPEDIGLFGYVAVSGSVTNTIVENITINSSGYTNNNTFNQLFGTEIEDALNQSSSNCFHDANLTLTDFNGDIIQLRDEQGTKGRTRININSSSNTHTESVDTNNDGVGDTDMPYCNAYFTPTFPTGDSFNYTIRYSTNVLETGEDASGNPIVKINLNELKNNSQFNENNCQVDSRIYLVANITIDGYTYSRVVQTYLCQFISNNTAYADGGYSMKIYCDYVDQSNPESKIVTNYKHGNNVGYLAGHVDGTIKDCFVYNGTFNLNSVNTMQPLLTESDTGLIGEIGLNVDNHIDPNYGLTENGDTGVMNFSGIYKIIRSDAKMNDKIYTSIGSENVNGTPTRRRFYAYNDYLNASSVSTKDGNQIESWKIYKEFLRHDDNSVDSNKHYITNLTDNPGGGATNTNNSKNYTITDSKYLIEANTVDFKPNTVISDTDDMDRGLGVFNIATAKSTNNPVGYLDGIGKSVVVNDTQITKVYFSTAELDRTLYNSTYEWENSNGIMAPSSSKYYLENVATLPSYIESSSFTPQYERDFDYIFEMNLADSNKTNGNNYFYNTDSAFLQSYLYYKLIGKNQERIEPGNRKFGFMLRSSEADIVNSLSSYMPVFKPTAKFEYESSYYPANTITFNISSESANVSVIASGESDVVIYGYNPSSDSTNDISPKYEMFSRSINRTTSATEPSIYDNMKYFTYDPENDGATTTIATVPDGEDSLSRSGKAFAHIFKLKKGSYCIGSASDSKSAKIYYLAVQGQTDSNMDSDAANISIGDAVADVDFYLYNPETTSIENRKRANFTFKSYYNVLPGVFQTVTTNDHKVKIIFDASQGFTESIYATCANTETHTFYVNDQQFDMIYSYSK